MSLMYQVITNLPCNPVINTPCTTPISNEERKKLGKLLSPLSDEVAGMMAGMASIGDILCANAGQIDKEDLVNVGWLISILSSTVDGLLFISNEGEAILKRPEKEVKS